MYFLKLLLSYLITSLPMQDSGNLYQIEFKDITGINLIRMSDYIGKKIVILEFNAASPDASKLKSLDTLYRGSKGQFEVIAIPVNDFGTPLERKALESLLKDSLGLTYLFSDSGIAQKSAGSSQHPLLKWLTDVNDNLHFNDDITEDDKMFILSDAGTLYAILNKDFRPNNPLMQTILNNEPINQLSDD